MLVARHPLVTSLIVGGMTAVAAFVTVSGPLAAKPTGPRPAAQVQEPSTTTTAAPCPAGTVETADACLRTVTASPAPVPPATPVVNDEPADLPAAVLPTKVPRAAGPAEEFTPEPRVATEQPEPAASPQAVEATEPDDGQGPEATQEPEPADGSGD